MAFNWSKIFTNWPWHNKDTARDTPLSAQNLQKLNDAIDTIDGRVVSAGSSIDTLDTRVGSSYSSQLSLDSRVTTLEQGGGGGGHYVENEETTGDYVTVLSGRLRLYGSQTTSQAPGTIELESYGDTTIKSDSGSVDIKVGSSGGRILLGANLNNIYKPTHFQNEMHVYYQATDAQYHVNYGTTFKVNSDGVTIKDWYGTSETAMRIKGREIHTIDKVHIKTEYNSSTSSNTGGNLEVDGTITVNGSDYAEKFETIEDCPVGRFVTLDGEKIRLAQPGDDYILGVTSENPAIIGDKDNPGTPVGLVGKLWVESDGICKVNGFAVSGADGIATDGGSTGYRVMAVDGNRVKILVK